MVKTFFKESNFENSRSIFNNFTFGKIISDGIFLGFLIKIEEIEELLFFFFFKVLYVFFDSCHFRKKKNFFRTNNILERVYRELFHPFFKIKKTKHLKINFHFISKKIRRFLVFEISKNFLFKKFLKCLTILFSMGIRCCLVYGKIGIFLRIHITNNLSSKKINSIKKILKKF